MRQNQYLGLVSRLLFSRCLLTGLLTAAAIAALLSLGNEPVNVRRQGFRLVRVLHDFLFSLFSLSVDFLCWFHRQYN